jgi:hypothetical protein
MPDITSPPPHQSVHRDECRDDIKAILAKAARETVERLNYTRDEAADILIAALAEYLDERFSVTSRRKLGWAKSSLGFWTLVASLAPSYPDASRSLRWTATALNIARYLRSRDFNATAVTVERELLDHAATDPNFPWIVSLDEKKHELVFTPKA